MEVVGEGGRGWGCAGGSSLGLALPLDIGGGGGCCLLLLLLLLLLVLLVAGLVLVLMAALGAWCWL